MTNSHTVACDLVSETIENFGRARLRVTGLSMLPSLLPHDVLGVERCSITELALSDLVLFKRDDRLVTHRVIFVERREGARCLITRGDATRHMDPPVGESKLLGRVVAIERDGRLISVSSRWSFLHRAVGRVLPMSPLAIRSYVRLRELWRFFRRYVRSTQAFPRKETLWQV